MFRRLFPIFLFLLILSGVYAYVNRVYLLEKLMGPEITDVPSLSFAEVQEINTTAKTEAEKEPLVKKEGAMTGTVEVENDLPDIASDSSVEAPAETASADLIEEWNLAIPWTPQAPFANWDETHEDTCEEASIYMAWLYFQGYPEGLVDPTMADEALLEMVRLENDYFGFFKSTTAAQTADFAKKYYDLDYELIYTPTVEQIKAAVVQGYPVAVPMAGQILANPYFTPPGPEYHMLLVKGFTADGFITNDPGTRHGENYVYEFDHFMEAIHDYNAGNVEKGQAVVIVFKP